MNILQRIFGINYRTSILGIGVIFTAAGRLAVAFKSKDFTAMATDGELVMTTAAALLGGWGLYVAKDASVTGTGSGAKTVDSEGTVTNVAGREIGKQPTMAEATGAGASPTSSR